MSKMEFCSSMSSRMAFTIPFSQMCGSSFFGLRVVSTSRYLQQRIAGIVSKLFRKLPAQINRQRDYSFAWKAKKGTLSLLYLMNTNWRSLPANKLRCIDIVLSLSLERYLFPMLIAYLLSGVPFSHQNDCLHSWANRGVSSKTSREQLLPLSISGYAFSMSSRNINRLLLGSSQVSQV